MHVKYTLEVLLPQFAYHRLFIDGQIKSGDAVFACWAQVFCLDNMVHSPESCSFVEMQYRYV